jgi:outer membrane receptor protein involved in Fe transport
MDPARIRYLFSRTVINAGIGYQWRPSVTFSIDINNLTIEPMRQIQPGNLVLG